GKLRQLLNICFDCCLTGSFKSIIVESTIRPPASIKPKCSAIKRRRNDLANLPAAKDVLFIFDWALQQTLTPFRYGSISEIQKIRQHGTAYSNCTHFTDKRRQNGHENENAKIFFRSKRSHLDDPVEQSLTNDVSDSPYGSRNS
uniref:Uncharacterized protein n=1 Tax=Romanomermis culicivorax TaxID=13658 RepID=A0A915JGV9_ROMCU